MITNKSNCQLWAKRGRKHGPTTYRKMKLLALPMAQYVKAMSRRDIRGLKLAIGKDRKLEVKNDIMINSISEITNRMPFDISTNKRKVAHSMTNFCKKSHIRPVVTSILMLAPNSSSCWGSAKKQMKSSHHSKTANMQIFPEHFQLGRIILPRSFRDYMKWGLSIPKPDKVLKELSSFIRVNCWRKINSRWSTSQFLPRHIEMEPRRKRSKVRCSSGLRTKPRWASGLEVSEVRSVAQRSKEDGKIRWKRREIWVLEVQARILETHISMACAKLVLMTSAGSGRKIGSYTSPKIDKIWKNGWWK